MVIKKIRISLLIGAITIAVIICLIFTFQHWRKQAVAFPIRNIKIGKLNDKTKEVLYTSNLVRGDRFLMSFQNFQDTLPLTIILINSTKAQDILFSNIKAKSGNNEICCFETPDTTGQYILKFISGQQEISEFFEVKDRMVEYKDFKLRGVGSIPYPAWQILDPGIMTKLLIDIFSYYSKDLGKGVSVLLALEDEAGVQFTISQRVVSNYKNLPFGNLVQIIEENENKALLKAGVIDDYTILNKTYGEREIYLKIRNISKGRSYIVFNKTYLEKSFLNKKFLLSISITCPEGLVIFYQPIIDHIFSNINLTSSAK